MSCLLVYAADIDANGFVALCFLVFLGSIVHSGNTICVGRGGGSACVFSEATLVTTERLHVLRVLK